jgi:hypothetical protein
LADYIEHPPPPSPVIGKTSCPRCFGDFDHKGVCCFCGYIRPRPPVDAEDLPPADGGGAVLAGLDLGQLQDHTALVLVRKILANGAARYQVPAIKRFELGTSYTAIVEKVSAWLSTPPWDKAPIVTDQTGVGVAVLDMFRGTPLRARMVPVTITAGRAVTFERGRGGTGGWHVAKVQLVSALQALLSGHRLDVSQKLPDAPDLVKELKHFKAKVTLAGNETFEAWRERDKDDMVLALALACWYAERGMRAQVAPLGPPPSADASVDDWTDR